MLAILAPLIILVLLQMRGEFSSRCNVGCRTKGTVEELDTVFACVRLKLKSKKKMESGNINLHKLKLFKAEMNVCHTLTSSRLLFFKSQISGSSTVAEVGVVISSSMIFEVRCRCKMLEIRWSDKRTKSKVVGCGGGGGGGRGRLFVKKPSKNVIGGFGLIMG